MINRPRCRDWSPLATQQLRLRNLIQITGHNIDAEANTSIYFTLHLTLMSAPFFTSERLESFRNAIWAEINCQSIQKSTSQFVVVRVWQTNQTRPNESLTSDTNNLQRSLHSVDSTISTTTTKIEKRNENKDKVLFVWGVYLSGLIPITKRSDVQFKDNALVFYIHGGFFTSANFILPDSVPMQYNKFHCFKNQPTNSLIWKDNATLSAINSRNSINTIYSGKHCDSFISNKTQSDNHSDANGGISSKTVDIGERFSSSSDVIVASFAQTQSDNHYLPNDPNMLKVRYAHKDFYRWEIRKSYNVKKLLLLQGKQRVFRKESISANELMEKICMKSASCLNLKLIADKGMMYRPKVNPSLGRTLNRLLTTQPEQPKPEDLLKAQELRRRIETAKFRCRFLAVERDRYKTILRKLHEKCAKLSDENIEKESWLMDDYRELSRSRDMAIEQKTLYSNKFRIYENVKEMLVQRQFQLLRQLKDIYIIKNTDQSDLMEINGICLPNTDALRMYYTTNAASNLSVAMCYVAHVVLLCSSVLNIPLRNKIIFQGSASKIRDDIKVLSEHDREFPLYCRYIPPSDSLLYAAFLLNQNISQIKFMLNIHNNREDIRATLSNLLAILSVGEKPIQRPYTIQESISSSHLTVDSVDQPMSSISESSIDMIISVPAKKAFSSSEENISSTCFLGQKSVYKVSRSYSNDQLATCHESFKVKSRRGSVGDNYGSEPILPTGQLS